MIQDIGINISATGASQVANEFNQIGNALQHLKSGLSGLNQVQQSITNLSSGITALDGAAHKLRSAGADIASFARQGSSAIASLNGQITALTSNMAHLTRAGHGGGTPGGGGSTMFGSMGFQGPLRFMAPYYIAMKAMQGIKYGTTEIAMGGSREEIAKSNINLAAVSADRDQRSIIEQRAHEFSQKYPMVSAPQYIDASAQTASAMDIQKLGAGTIARITEQNIKGAKLSNMNESAFAEAQSKIMTSYLSRFDANVRDTLMSGGAAEVPGFGRVTLPQLHGRIVAMTAKVVEKTNIWGQGLMDFYSYAGSMAGEKGMPLADVFAMGGVLSDLGFKGAKSGRALKSILAGQSDRLANVVMVGQNQYDPSMTKQQKAAFEEQKRPITAKINELAESAEGQAQLAKLLAPGLARAMAMSKDPNVALSLTKDLGISSDFLPQILALYKDSSAKRMTDLAKDVAESDISELNKKLDDVASDTGFQLRRLSATWSGFASSLAITAQDMFGDISKSLGIVDTLTSLKSKLDSRNAKYSDNQHSASFDKRPTGGSGNYTDATGEQIMAAPGLDYVKDQINKRMRKEWIDRKGEITSDEDRQRVRAEIMERGLSQWDDFWKPKRDRHIPHDTFFPSDDPGGSDMGIPHSTTAPGLPRQPLMDAYNQNDLQGQSYKWLRDYMESTADPARPQQQSALQADGNPTALATSTTDQEPVQVTVNNKYQISIGGRDVRDFIVEVLSENRFTGRDSTNGSFV